MKYEHLLSPIKINSLILPNRVLHAPMSEAEIPERFETKAAVNIVGCVSVDHETARGFNIGGNGPFDKYGRSRTREQLNLYRHGGSLVSAEIHHSGVWTFGDVTPNGPSKMINAYGKEVHELTKEELEEIAKAYGRTCAMAKDFGFDMCMLHFAHGWLIPQFLSPMMNHRTDEFGGSLENRMRFPLMCLKEARAGVGPNYPLDMRVSASEWVEEGYKFEEIIEFVKEASKYIDMVNVSSGLDMDKRGAIHLTASVFENHCLNAEWAREIRKNVNIPVAVVGSIETPEEADKLIAEGYCDMVTIGRAFMADPDWLKKAMEERSEDIVPCIRCNNCEHWSTERWNHTCSVNMRVNREKSVPRVLPKADKVKNCVVIGGGPAGMKAALTLKERGHNVSLIEASDKLGGALKHADYDTDKVDIKRYKDYLIRQTEKANINVILNKKADKAYVASLKPDAVVIALGAEAIIPNIEGKELCLKGFDCYENADKLPNNLVIIGGGAIGCELGLLLAHKGKKVTILEMTDKLHRSHSVFYDGSVDYQMDLVKDKLSAITNVKVTKVEKDSVTYIDKDGKECRIATEATILSAGYLPKTDEAFDLFGITPDTHVIGDNLRVAQIREANETAFFTCQNI